MTSRAWSPQTSQFAGGDEGDLDVLVLGREPGPVYGLLGGLGQVDGTRFAERGGDLQPAEVHDLLDQPGQARRLDLHPPGEASHGLGVVVRVEDRLGQQGHAADRRLELVAHVGEEVAADLLEPAGLAAVLDEEQHVVRAERGHAGADDESRPAGRTLAAGPARPRG